MTPAGERAFAQRKEHKSVVYAYEQAATPELSAAELRAFKHDKPAWNYFETAPPGYRKSMLHWVTTAKKPETRTSRFDTLVQACGAGKRLR